MACRIAFEKSCDVAEYFNGKEGSVFCENTVSYFKNYNLKTIQPTTRRYIQEGKTFYIIVILGA
jgi:hypothetical protein